MKSTRLGYVFTNGRGKVIEGQMLAVEERPRALALLAHCLGQGRGRQAADVLSEHLAGGGIGVLQLDFAPRASGSQPQAEAEPLGVDDLIAAADSLRQTHAAPQLLIGHSLGGAAVIAAARRISEARAVVTIGAPSDGAFVQSLLAAPSQPPPEVVAPRLRLGGRSFPVSRAFLEDIAAPAMQRHLRFLGAPLMIMHSPHDEIVPIDHARIVFDHARHPKSFLALDRADHLLSNASDAQFAAEIILPWSKRYLTP